MTPYVATGPRVGIRRPTPEDREEFLALTRASEAFHRPWGDWPKTPERFDAYLASRQAPSDDGFLVCDRASHAILGAVNLNCVVRGLFQSAYLGYWVGAPYAGRGYMTEGLNLVTRFAFGELGLHRLEANIQPANVASLRLVRACGFRMEGFSPRYLKIGGEWRDHERWALLADDEASVS
jgi:ribosomal-protein-alanine N-acetyltransferase